MTIRVARIPYLNSAPFYRGLPEDVELLDLPPRQLGEAARTGAVDAGILSLCDIFRIPGLCALGDLGVAVRGPSHSVLLLSRERPEQLRGARIAVTAETSTSFPLLRLLLEGHYDIDDAVFERSPHSQDVDAELLIGDAALRAAAAGGLIPGRSEYGADPMRLERAAGQPWRWALDLAAVWERWQELPFVFAEWVAREEVVSDHCAPLAAALEQSLAWSEQHLPELCAETPAPGGLDAAAAVAYLEGFTYRLGPQERRAVERFRDLIESSAWWQADAGATKRQRG